MFLRVNENVNTLDGNNRFLFRGYNLNDSNKSYKQSYKQLVCYGKYHFKKNLTMIILIFPEDQTCLLFAVLTDHD